MPNYAGIQKEETLKSLVHEDYFVKFGYEPNIDNIDFVVTDKKTRGDLFSDGPGSSRHYLWAEAKKGSHDVFTMFTQLVLTCKKTYEKGEYLAPPWLGVFDEARISFAAFHDMLPIFTETDFNWNTTPSNHEAVDFIKAREKVKNIIGAKIVTYNFGMDDSEIKEFIKTHFIFDGAVSIKSPITKDNFVQIFIKWVKEVKPFINIGKDEWVDFKKKGILDCDFYRADMMSSGGNTITEKLKIVLKNDNYKFQENIDGRLFTSDIGFTDNGESYSRFWNKYERPPAKVFQQFIIDRRDLLVPQNIREVKGSFFTPKIWADKSKEYLAAVFGADWQEEYYIWDCAAGTGNLLAGLTNEYNIWASDIEQGNIETIQSLIDIDENLRLLPGHVFQFDFLNDSFDKLPEELRKIIHDEEKRKRLIVYINPPYAEHGNRSTFHGTGKEKHKAKVAIENKIHGKFNSLVGAATRELFVQFLLRVYTDVPSAKIATFSTLKYINAPNFVKFREFFKAEYRSGFICPAYTFDNVSGKFPICFSIWNPENKKKIEAAMVDVFDENEKHIGNKNYFSVAQKSYMIDWFRAYTDRNANQLGSMRMQGNDMQQQNNIAISSFPTDNDLKERIFTYITENNLIAISIYYAVKHCIEPTWINNRDQFLFPDNKYIADLDFHNNCLIYSIFHNQNYISSNDSTNHWIPFAEKEVSAKEKFESAFMSKFLKDKTFSAEAHEVINAGRELWKYYHLKIKNNKTAPVNASFYDIREFFQGRNDAGKMNNKSADETYNALIGTLRNNLNVLAKKIEPKVYEYGFLKE